MADSLVDAWIDLDEILKHLKKELKEPLEEANKIKENYDKVTNSLRDSRKHADRRKDRSLGAKIQMI